MVCPDDMVCPSILDTLIPEPVSLPRRLIETGVPGVVEEASGSVAMGEGQEELS